MRKRRKENLGWSLTHIALSIKSVLPYWVSWLTTRPKICGGSSTLHNQWWMWTGRHQWTQSGLSSWHLSPMTSSFLRRTQSWLLQRWRRHWQHCILRGTSPFQVILDLWMMLWTTLVWAWGLDWLCSEASKNLQASNPKSSGSSQTMSSKWLIWP